MSASERLSETYFQRFSYAERALLTAKKQGLACMCLSISDLRKIAEIRKNRSKGHLGAKERQEKGRKMSVIPTKLFQDKLLDHVCHAVLLVAVGDVVGRVLDVFRRVGHGHAEPREAYHALVVVAVTAGDDLLATDAGQLKEAFQRVSLVDAGRHALQEETG